MYVHNLVVIKQTCKFKYPNRFIITAKVVTGKFRLVSFDRYGFHMGIEKLTFHNWII